MFRRKDSMDTAEGSSPSESSSAQKKSSSLSEDSSSSMSSIPPGDCLECSSDNAPPTSCLLLLAAPTVCGILGVALTPKFLVLAVVYLIAAARPLLTALLNRFSKQSHRDDDALPLTSTTNDFNAMVRTSLNSHRSITIQFSMLAACLFVYEKSRVLCVGQASQDTIHIAFGTAKTIILMENAMGLDFEPLLQTCLLQNNWLVAVGNFYYAVMHFVVPLGVMAILVLQNRDPHFQHRLSFFIMLMMALVVFVSLPTMPPRLMGRYQREYTPEINEEEADIIQPYWSIVDTMAKGDTLYDKLHSEGGNPYAAMPSMHTGWALWSALVLMDVLPSKTTTWLATLHVFWTIFFILLTGNHFWLDAVGGAACVFFGRIVSLKIVGHGFWKRRRSSEVERGDVGGGGMSIV